MSQVLRFPTPLPLLDKAQDTSAQQDLLNQLIAYINTIVYGDNAALLALLKANNLSDLANVATARANLQLGSASTHSASDFDAAGAAAAVLATSLQKAQNLADLPNKATARTNLQLGSASTHAYADFDPAGAAAARAAQGINSDITALTALAISLKSTNYTVVKGDQTLECNAALNPITITYKSSVAAGRVLIVKTDATYNPVNISNGSSVVYSLVAPAVLGFMQSATAYTNGSAVRVTG